MYVFFGCTQQFQDFEHWKEVCSAEDDKKILSYKTVLWYFSTVDTGQL